MLNFIDFQHKLEVFNENDSSPNSWSREKTVSVTEWPVGAIKQEEREMLQEGDKTILTNVAKVIAVLVVIMFCLIFLASYIGGDAYK